MTTVWSSRHALPNDSATVAGDVDVIGDYLALVGEQRVTNPDTGGMKGSKPERMDLIPVPAMEELGRVYEFGARKYEAHNWRRGYAWSLSIAALLRHIFRFMAGETRDPESGLHHLAHAMFHCCSLITWDTEHPELDDRCIPGRDV